MILKHLCRNGYVPMSTKDPAFIAEENREKRENFCQCRCSNCEPEDTKILVKNMKSLTVNNFEAALKNPSTLLTNSQLQLEIAEDAIEVGNQVEARGEKAKKVDCNSSNELSELNCRMRSDFQRHYETIYGSNGDLGSSVFLNDAIMNNILSNLTLIHTASDLLTVIGCDILTGGVQVLFDSINLWRSSVEGQNHESLIEKDRLELERSNRAADLGRVAHAEAEKRHVIDIKILKLARRENKEAGERAKIQKKLLKDEKRKRKVEEVEALQQEKKRKLDQICAEVEWIKNGNLL